MNVFSLIGSSAYLLSLTGPTWPPNQVKAGKAEPISLGPSSRRSGCKQLNTRGNDPLGPQTQPEDSRRAETKLGMPENVRPRWNIPSIWQVTRTPRKTKRRSELIPGMAHGPSKSSSLSITAADVSAQEMSWVSGAVRSSAWSHCEQSRQRLFRPQGRYGINILNGTEHDNSGIVDFTRREIPISFSERQSSCTCADIGFASATRTSIHFHVSPHVRAPKQPLSAGMQPVLRYMFIPSSSVVYTVYRWQRTDRTLLLTDCN